MRRAGAYGPYRRGDRWRVVTVETEGQRGTESFESEAEARDFIEQYRADVREEEGPTVSALLAEYGKSRVHLAAFFRGLEERQVPGIKPEDCQSAYSRMVKEGYAAATHREALAAARRFFKWLIKVRKVRRSNPCEDIEATGTANRGKAQLTLDEARAFVRVACELGDAGNPTADALLLPLILGMRSTESRNRLVRHLDDGGRLLRTASKTRKGTRTLEVPGPLRERLLRRAAGKRGEERLFPEATSHTMGYWCARICALAGIPRVCPHGLRGTHTTLATEAGITGPVVAQQLGWESIRVGEEHYIDPDAMGSARVASVALKLLAGGKR